MANAAVARTGQVNQANDVDALFLKMFAGEVLTAFQESQQILDKHMVRTITSGKSAQFPVHGRTVAHYHTPGTEILGIGQNQNEKVITIDDLLISHSFIANIDEAKQHYDVRSVYSTEHGRALARQFESHVFQQAVLGSRASTLVTGLPDGQQVAAATANDFTTGGGDPDKLADALFAAAEILDENDVPREDRYAFFRPAQYYALVKSSKAIHRDFGGSGSYAEGRVFTIAGISIIESNNVPSSNVQGSSTPSATVYDVAAGGTSDRHVGDFSLTRGLVMHKSAVGTVKLMDLAVESEYDIRRQGTLMVAKYAMGHGWLRPEASVEIKDISV